MSRSLDKLNLRPGEKRLVVITGVAVFVVLNLWYIWPHFGDLGKAQQQLQNDREAIEKYEREIAKKAAHKRRLDELQKQGGTLATEQQALQLQVIVQRQATASGVAILSTDSRSAGSGRSSEFFNEQHLRVTANSGDKELVDFLTKLGAGDSLIRVRDLTVSPDPSGTRLNSQITFVASFQRSPAAARKTVTTAKTK